MTHDESDRRWTTALGAAEATLLRDGVLHPAFLMVGRDGRGGPVAADFGTREAWADTYALLRLACMAAAAVFVAYMGEAEAAAGDVLPGDGGAAGIETRVEVLVVSAAARPDDGGGRAEFRTSLREILRGADGRPWVFATWCYLGAGTPTTASRTVRRTPTRDRWPTCCRGSGRRPATKRRGRGQPPFARHGESP